MNGLQETNGRFREGIKKEGLQLLMLFIWFQLDSILPPFHRTIHYYAQLGQRTVFPTCEVPEHFVSEVTVLKYFSHYMEENLMDVSRFSCLLNPFVP